MRKTTSLLTMLLTPILLTACYPFPALVLLALLIAGVSFPPVLLILVMLAPFFTEETGLVPF